MEEEFDLESFYARVEASAKERHALRQDLVRGLKDWFLHQYGYDRYGAETVFLLPERMGQPRIYGFALLRILRDRRISESTKLRAAEQALEIAQYGSELGPPFGWFEALHFLAARSRLSLTDLRYALTLAGGYHHPFEGIDKRVAADFLRMLLDDPQIPVEERVFWAHSLIAHHGDQAGGADPINLLLGNDHVPVELRRELGWAWVNARQPRIEVEVPKGTDERSRFVAEHMPFWIAHMPSWPSHQMVRLGLTWLARLGEDPLMLARAYIGPSSAFADQIHAAVADIIAEHHECMPAAEVRDLLEQGVAISSSIPTRKRFYRLGSALFGMEYLERAAGDTAGSVRQWATRQLQK